MRLRKIQPYILGGLLIILVGALTQQKRFANAGESLANSMSAPQSQEITIIKVKDGDTVKLADGRDIRFCGIDAPETQHGKQPAQPGGEDAKKYLQALVNKANGKGYIEVTDVDRYGRTVGEITLRIQDYPNGEVNANSEMIASGNAWFYKKYAKCPNAQSFEIAEQRAAKQRLGVHANPGFEKPWDFRRRLKEEG